ncbi:MAG TPA: erythromycin esterase family protein [Kofleriaceae bacterium]|nr:erythromycin esterase family protein [Kofleriaceae bacterium]
MLARRLDRFHDKDVVVLALPRGGVPVAYEVARRLRAPLDLLVVRKLGVPGYDELAMGAIASGGIQVKNDHVITRLRIPPAVIAEVAAAEQRELGRRELAYRGNRAPIDVRDRVVILVDDGLATGATMRAAVASLRKRAARSIVVAVPVGAADTCREMGDVADEVVCASQPEDLGAVGVWYEAFEQIDDGEVTALLGANSGDSPTPVNTPAPALMQTPVLTEGIAHSALPLTGRSGDLDPVMEMIGDARCVLIGESTHGSHEFYKLRAELTKRLIREKGFAAVAIEGDWPDAYRVNRYVRGVGEDRDASEALDDFRRFPQWMWRNADMLDFVGWLRDHNEHQDVTRQIGFYGLDLYSLHGSIEAVLDYLDRTDPDAAARARDRYVCFDQFGSEPERYGYGAGFGLEESCERAVVEQLRELQSLRAERVERDGLVTGDERFAFEMNARVAAAAEEYYRMMFHDQVASWNLRDTHMADTLDALLAHLDQARTPSKIVVWAHNSHVGDARATLLGEVGELDLGQLCRQRHPGDTALIGFTTYAGTVTAASEWGGPAERKLVRPALVGSYEELFHRTGLPRFLLMLRELGEATGGLHEPRLERAIGVIYRPDSERVSHYLRARLPAQFDAVFHIDETRALEPMERTAGWERGELPETYPSGV